jgi:hypothetical protein
VNVALRQVIRGASAVNEPERFFGAGRFVISAHDEINDSVPVDARADSRRAERVESGKTRAISARRARLA